MLSDDEDLDHLLDMENEILIENRIINNTSKPSTSLYIDDDDNDDLQGALMIDDQIGETQCSSKASLDRPSKRTILNDELIQEEQNETSRKRLKSIIPAFNPSTSNNLETIDVPREERYYLSRTIPDSDFISLILNDNRRYYVKMLDDSDTISNNSLKTSCMIDEIELSDLVENALNLNSSKKKIEFDFESNHEDLQNKLSSNNSLWVRKYAPKSYLHLVSAESVNRSLLTWIKAWDPYVFGREPPFQKSNLYEEQKNYSRQENFEQSINKIDPRDNRPVYKIVLISGPPGLGKTTMSHLIAEKAGYQVVEINASDDRSPEIIRQRVETAVNSTGCLQGDLKPCCLILDEIDGALSSTIDIIAEAAKTFPQDVIKSKKTKRQPLVLRRPIICICNELYSKSLKSLRAANVPCLMLKVPPPDEETLINRLRYIVEQESFPGIERNILRGLIDICDRDMRACVNALQFLLTFKKSSGLANQTITLDDLKTSVNSSGFFKDSHSSLFNALNRIFTLPLNNQKLTDDKNVRSRISQVLSVCESSGDAQLIASAVFENYLNARMRDATLGVVSDAIEWLEFHDHVWSHIYSTQRYEMQRYSSQMPAWFNLNMASHFGLTKSVQNETQTGRKWYQQISTMKWPTCERDCQQSLRQYESILETVWTNQWIAPQSICTNFGSNVIDEDYSRTSLRLLDRRTFILDAAPLLVKYIELGSASLRPVNAQLYNKTEQEFTASLVNKFIALGLQWKPDNSNETNTVSLQLDPPLDKIVRIETKQIVDKNNKYLKKDETLQRMAKVPLSLRQLISREIRLKLMHKTENFDETGSKNQTNSLKNSTQQKKGYITQSKEALSAMNADSNEIKKNKPKRDFFGRIINPNVELCKKKTSSMEIDEVSKENLKQLDKLVTNETVWFKFNEGFSCAVRRPVTMKKFVLL